MGNYKSNALFKNIPLTGVLIPGITDGYIAESKYIKGGYIVVPDIDSRDALLDTSVYEDFSLDTGAPVYVVEENKTYRYVGGDEIWQENDADQQAIKAEIEEIKTSITTIEEKVSAVEEALTSKADTESVYTKAETDEKVTWDYTISTTKHTVGGLEAGTDVSGLSLKEILYYILVGPAAPIITEPTLKVEVTSDKTIGIAGMPITISGTITFDRGSIQTVTDGGEAVEGEVVPRAGVVLSFTVNGVRTAVASDDAVFTTPFSTTISSLAPGSNTIEVSVEYEEGPQPYRNDGVTKYGEPLPAGSMSETIEVFGVASAFVGTSVEDAEEQTLDVVITDDSATSAIYTGLFHDLDEEGNVLYTGLQLRTPEITAPGQVATVLIQEGIELMGIKIWDNIVDEWCWYNVNTGDDLTEEEAIEQSLSAFTKSEETYVKEIDGVEINYYAYSYTGTATGEMRLRFYVE